MWDYSVSAVERKRSFWERSSHKACLISERKWGIRLSSRFSHPSLMGHLSWESWRRSANERKVCSISSAAVLLWRWRDNDRWSTMLLITFHSYFHTHPITFLLHSLLWRFDYIAITSKWLKHFQMGKLLVQTLIIENTWYVFIILHNNWWQQCGGIKGLGFFKMKIRMNYWNTSHLTLNANVSCNNTFIPQS